MKLYRANVMAKEGWATVRFDTPIFAPGPQHKANAVEKLGAKLGETLKRSEQESRQEPQPSGADAVGNLERFRNVSLVRRGLGLAPAAGKVEQIKMLRPRRFGGGGGNRTPVRRLSIRYDYMLSRCFDLARRAPTGRVSRSYPAWVSASSPPAGESAHPAE